jgi:hypothetical protein
MVAQARITDELMIGFTKAQRQGIEIACTAYGMRASQYVRQATFEKLIRDGILPAPTLLNNNPVPSEAAE